MTGTEILQSKYQELYTPAAGIIRTTNTELCNGVASLQLKRATFSCTEDGTIDYYAEGGGDKIVEYPVKAGVAYPYLVNRITACTSGVYIHHNGEVVPYSQP